MSSGRAGGRLRARVLLAIALSAVFVVGTVVGNTRAQRPPGSGGSPAASRPRAEPAAFAGPGPSGTTADGLPVGWTHDTAGATAAAVADATANQAWLYMDDDAIRRSVTAIGAHDSTGALVRYVLDAVRPARTALRASPRQVWWVVRPLATRALNVTGDRATVSVWVVSILSAMNVAMPQSTWVTTTVELVWERGDWRLSKLSDRPGPTPELDSSDRAWKPEDLNQALDGFRLLPVGTTLR